MTAANRHERLWQVNHRSTSLPFHKGEGPTSSFYFFGGHIAVDFVNTVVIEAGAPVDHLSSPAALAGWVSASGLGAEFGVPVTVDAATYALAKELRAALKDGYSALVHGEPIPDQALATVNGVLRSGPGTELRRPVGGGLERALRVDLASDPRSLPWILANAGAELMTSDQASMLRRCANHDSCVLLFLDTSRSRTRRWCSMELCGNRSKVAAHAARSRDQQPVKAASGQRAS